MTQQQQIPTSLSDYLARYSAEINRKIEDNVAPIHDPARDRPDLRLESLLRRPFPAQQHVVTAAVRSLACRRGLFVVGEMGTGKTLIGAAIAWCCAPTGRTLVMCPPHLTSKWAREITETIPNAETREIRTVSDVSAALKAENTNVPRFWIVSREAAKLDYFVRSGARTLAGKTTLGHYVVQARRRDTQRGVSVTITHSDGKKTDVHDTTAFCPECGQMIAQNDKKITIDAAVRQRLHCPECDRSYDRQENQPYYSRNPKRARRRYTALWQADSQKKHRISLAQYLKKRKIQFDVLLADEVHELKGSDSAQGNALGTLASLSRKIIGLTGTLNGGYASNLFYLLFRISPEKMLQSGFSYSQKSVSDWITRYGVRERVIRNANPAADRNARSRGSKNGSHTSTTTERPGINPRLFADFLADCAVFLELADVAENLPEYSEIPVPANLSGALRRNYLELENDLRSALAPQLARGNKRNLARMLISLLTYPDRPYDDTPIELADHGFVFPNAVPEDQILPKEQKLLEIVLQAHAQKRKTLVFCQFTNRRDCQPRLKQLLEQRGLRVEILYADQVPPAKRENWINEHVDAIDVLITNPKTVETGLDLIQFPVIVYYQTGYSLFTLRQSSRRSWRLGQTQPVTVYFLYYRETLQERALELMGSKLCAALALDGKISDDGLQALAPDVDDALALARALVDSSNGALPGVEKLWKQANKNPSTTTLDEPTPVAWTNPEPKTTTVKKTIPAHNSLVTIEQLRTLRDSYHTKKPRSKKINANQQQLSLFA